MQNYLIKEYIDNVIKVLEHLNKLYPNDIEIESNLLFAYKELEKMIINK